MLFLIPTLKPMVGMVVTTSPSLSLYRIVVLPAAAFSCVFVCVVGVLCVVSCKNKQNDSNNNKQQQNNMFLLCSRVLWCARCACECFEAKQQKRSPSRPMTRTRMSCLPNIRFIRLENADIVAGAWALQHSTGNEAKTQSEQNATVNQACQYIQRQKLAEPE